MEHRDLITLQKILSELSVAKELLGDASLDAFLENEMLKRAVCMTVINIGELAKSLTEQLKGRDPSIPWKAVSGFRDIAAHKYQTLRMEDVYTTVTSDFPILAEQIISLIEQ
ncbi:MAG: DUF86 domain-containing protein [Firmicutes bacterium]|nr:DUF86 domain-containing protein [Bacillota bacterium]